MALHVQVANPLHGVEREILALSLVALLFLHRESITWSWKTSKASPDTERGDRQGIHYMELKDCVVSAPSHYVVARIHYMELKGASSFLRNRPSRSIAMNPLHGVERSNSSRTRTTLFVLNPLHGVERRTPLRLVLVWTRPWIHYMELKGLEAILVALPWNPLYGVERWV